VIQQDPVRPLVLGSPLNIDRAGRGTPEVGTDGFATTSTEDGTKHISIGAPLGSRYIGKDRGGEHKFRTPTAGLVVQNEVLGNGTRTIATFDNRAAGTTVRFPVRLPAATTLAKSDDGGFDVQTTGSVSIVLFHIDAPWAKDATGRSLTTTFAVDGDSIVQTVDTTDAVYPVKADPTVYPVCGVISCSIFFSRSTTVSLTDSGGWALIGGPWSAACFAIGFPPAVIACVAMAGIYSFTGWLTARQAAASNACLKLTFPYTYPISIPYWGTSNTSNCHN
jgi:hypothetical protein